METNIFFRNLILRPGILLLLLGITYSCEKQQFGEEQSPEQKLRTGEMQALEAKMVYFSETFTITSKDALIAERSLENPDFAKFDDFTITVRNGKNGKTKVTKMEIMIDGKVVVTYKDFKRNASEITKSLPGLAASSTLRVQIEGSKGRFIIVTIECTSKSSSVTDIEGNIYKTTKIGKQWWMAENLKTTKLNDGTAIPVVGDDSEWLSVAADHQPAMSWFGNDIDNKSLYGGLYNWAAAGNDKLCPAGWHVPGSDEYYELCLFIDPDAEMGYFSPIAGGPLKEEGTEHWESPNTGATDEYGFTALPGGFRNVVGSFSGLGISGSWWSDGGLSSINISNDDTYAIFSEGGNEYGRSVRCVRD
ncbi:MAG TPA: fibrobacter succinogenes major paralogous domain-containing protein [Bacteroidales bacterium]|nr:fibrobacter succinogenes major paralogous domain-containing protein [Bacteroidales bacterium]